MKISLLCSLTMLRFIYLTRDLIENQVKSLKYYIVKSKIRLKFCRLKETIRTLCMQTGYGIIKFSTWWINFIVSPPKWFPEARASFFYFYPPQIEIYQDSPGQHLFVEVFTLFVTPFIVVSTLLDLFPLLASSLLSAPSSCSLFLRISFTKMYFFVGNFRYKLDGIVYSERLAVRKGVLRYAATGSQRARNRIVQELVPGDTRLVAEASADALSRDERCLLHFALSNTIWDHFDETSEESLCRPPPTEKWLASHAPIGDDFHRCVKYFMGI